MKSARTWSAVTFFVMTGVTFATAEDPGPAIGDRVFPHFGAILRGGTPAVDGLAGSAGPDSQGRLLATFRVYRVEQIDRDWLRLKDEKSDASGWARAEDLIPYQQAIAYFSHLIGSGPKAFLFNGRGALLLEKDEADMALADFNEAIRLEPKTAGLYMNRGLAWLQKKDFDRALTDETEAVRLDPKLAAAYSNRGLAWKGKREFAKALEDYDRALGLDPRAPAAHHNRAWLQATCLDASFRDGKAAVESAERAVSVRSWTNAIDLDALAAAHAEVGDFAAAVGWQEKAIALAVDEKRRCEFRARLKLYQAKTPYREP